MIDCPRIDQGFFLMIEYFEDQTGKPLKTYVPVSFGSKFFSPHLKQSTHAKEFLEVLFAFDSFAHILWEIRNSTIVSTDNCSFKQKQFLRAYGHVLTMC